MEKPSEHDKLVWAYVYNRGMSEQEAKTLVDKYQQLFNNNTTAFGEFVKSELESLRKEKRKFMRVDASVKIGYRNLGSESIGERSATRNLSASGVEILMEEKFPLGVLIELEIKLPEQEEALFVIGRVVRQDLISNTANGTDVYNTGIEFVRINVANRRRLIRYVYNTVRAKRIK